MPIRQIWGLRSRQTMSPELEQRLAFTATLSGSYEAASRLVERWGCPVDDSVIHTLVQHLGRQAETHTQKRLKQLPIDKHPERKPAELGVLMMDGWMARFRGAGWGRKRTRKERVEWHEIKTGVFYRQEQAAHTQGGRGMICQKIIVRLQGEPMELGQRLGWEALSAGLGRARHTLALADGGKWIWNVVADRWPHAVQLLDFYHASQHLWALGHAHHPKNEIQARDWVEKQLHQLRHGKEKQVIKTVVNLPRGQGEDARIIEREKGYIESQSGRMNYKMMARRGWPIGSGAVESACRQSQCRFKRPGQFWTEQGFRHLNALDEARNNNHWDELWPD